VKFSELGLNDSILEAIGYMGFENATPIQEQAIPLILDDKDLIACAQTGTGKTAAFILPVLNKICEQGSNGINTLVVCPTRELALQIDKEIQGFSYFAGADSFPVYGGGEGSDWDKQKNALTSGADIIVATPGKLLSHLSMGYVDLSNLKHFILDEADRMLDMGFHEDIAKIISYLPAKRQNLMFSATMPPKIRQLVKKTMVDPLEINIALSKPAEGVLQAAYCVFDDQKDAVIKSLIQDKPECTSIIIFTSTKKKVNTIVKALKGNGYEVRGVSSDLIQKDREEALRRFRSRQTRVVVATDVLARGIDIKDINLVINYDVPNDASDYVHRVGRTARADTTGIALTMISPSDMFRFKRIEELIDTDVFKVPVPEQFGPAPAWNPNAKGDKRGYGGGGGGGKKFYRNKKK
jgi:ATP-dependent RNA helicase RhlE|tara:strand:+ start:94 stop:1320 length:1227 start_codon:yes stop_codon:yes gene_type:complete